MMYNLYFIFFTVLKTTKLNIYTTGLEPAAYFTDNQQYTAFLQPDVFYGAFPHHSLVTFYIELRIMVHSEGLEPPARFHGFAHESALPTELTMQ